MLQKTYFAIKVNDIKESKDFIKWEIIVIKAHNYHEAKDDLKKQQPFEDFYIVPKTVLQYRDIIRKSTHKGI
jgi:hypothetical protein